MLKRAKYLAPKLPRLYDDMRIRSSDRVSYLHNPLQDVTGQVRFPPLLALDDALASKVQAAIAEDFPIVQTGQSMQVSITVGNGAPPPVQPPAGSQPVVYQFWALDQKQFVTLARDSVTLTVTNYEGWEKFVAKLSRIIELTVGIFEPHTVMRIGLRYRDIIERETMGLNDVPWRDLISPSVLGGLGLSDFFEDGDLEDHVKNTITISDIALDGYHLQLRHGLANKQPENRQCFLIDGDYYASSPSAFILADVLGTFERLHTGAGAVFRRCISERLHAALSPVASAAS